MIADPQLSTVWDAVVAGGGPAGAAAARALGAGAGRRSGRGDAALSFDPLSS